MLVTRAPTTLLLPLHLFRSSIAVPKCQGLFKVLNLKSLLHSPKLNPRLLDKRTGV